MTKSDFRATKSLSADLMRIEDSLTKNQKELEKSFNTVKTKVSEIQTKVPNVIEFRESIGNLTSAIRDHIEKLEDDMTGLEGLDLFDFKTSPDEVILNLRKCGDDIKNLDSSIEDNLKLIVKAKGNGMFKEEIDNSHKTVLSFMNSSEDYLTDIDSSIKSLLTEINHFKSHSKDLLQHKIY